MKKLLSTVLTASLFASGIGNFPITTEQVKAAVANANASTNTTETVKLSTTTNSTETPESVTDLSKYKTNQVIVVYKKEANATEKKTLRIASLSTKEEQNAEVSQMTDSSVVLSVDSKDTLADAVDTLSQDSRVAYVQPNYIYHVTADTQSALENFQSNPEFSKQWAYYNDGSMNYSEIDYRTVSSNNSSWNWWPFSASKMKAAASNSANYETLDVQAVKGVDINLDEAWDACKATGTRETIVAFVDTGVMYDHEDLIDNMWVNQDEIPDDGIDNDGNGYIDDVYGWNFYASQSSGWWGFDQSSSQDSSRFPGSNLSSNGNNTYYNANSATEDSHGTHGAGTVAAVNNDKGVVGIASNSNTKIMTVKALGGSDGTGTTEAVVKGIEYAVANGANIVNLSLGGEEDDASLRQVIEDNPNVLFTIAAGNGDNNCEAVDNDSTPTYPANYNFDNVLSVANIQCDGTLHYSSNYGATTVQLAAPGANIFSTSTENEEEETDSSNYYNYNTTSAVSGYESMTGTSMAAPMVAGVAAMLYSKYDSYSMIDIKNAILNSVTKMDSLTGKVSTGGMLNAYGAVQLLEGKEITSSTPVPTPIYTSTTVPVVSSTPSVKPGRPTTNPVLTEVPTQTSTANTTANPAQRTSSPSSTRSPSTGTPATQPASSTVTTTPGVPNSHATTTPSTTTGNNQNSTNAPSPTESSTAKNTTANNSSVTSTPSTTSTIKTSATPAGTTVTNNLSIDNISISDSKCYIGNEYSITVSASGGTGELTYDFFLSHAGKNLTQTSKNATFKWTPDTAGAYTVIVYVKDNQNNICNRYTTITVENMKVSLSKNKTLKKGRTITFTSKTDAGISPFTYRFIIYRNGKKLVNTSTKKNSIKYKITRSGTYKIKVTVRDKNGNTASKILTQKVK